MAQQPQSIDLSKLPVPQMQQIKQQLEQEIQYLTESLQQLSMANARFLESQRSCRVLTSDNEGKEILVPLTTSLYVPGQLVDTSRVLLDIGTGYFLERDAKAAEGFFQRKADFIQKNCQTISDTINAKRQNLDVITDMLAQRMQAMMQSQAASS